MKKVLNPERVWEIMEKNVYTDLGPTSLIAEQREWPVFVEGHGIYLRDIEGKEYIDGTGIAKCTPLGHGNRRVIEAIKEQLDKLQITLPMQSDVALLLSEKIAQLAPPGLNRVYLSVTGSHAVEASMILTRQYFKSQGKPNHIIITQWLSYHGASRGSMGATGIAAVKSNRGRDISDVDSGVYHVLPPYCYRCPYDLEYPQCGIQCAKIIDEMIKHMGPDNVAGFMAEPILSTGGAITPPPEYWPIVREICDKHKILLIFDEIVTGWGRLGKLWASELFNITPDIILTGKGLTAGYMPLTAMILRDHIGEYFSVKDAQLPLIVRTHSSHPLGCAAALATIDVIMEERLWENAAQVGAHLKGRLEDIAQKSKIVGAVHGVGLALAVELVEDKRTKAPSPSLAAAINEKCREKGLNMLLGMAGAHNQLYILPALIITKEQSDRLCDIFSESVEEVETARR